MPEAVSLCVRDWRRAGSTTHREEPSNTANFFPSPSLERGHRRQDLPEGRQHPRDWPAYPPRAATARRWPKCWPRSRHHLRDSCHSRIPHRGQFELGISGYGHAYFVVRCGVAILRLTGERCAFVWSSKGKIVWAKRSDDFRFGLPRDKWIEKDTYAFDCSQNQSVPTEPRSVPADLWLRPDNLQSGAMIWEESRFLPNFESAVTLLWIKERIEKFSDFDDQEDPSLDPTEFTIHRTKWPGS